MLQSLLLAASLAFTASDADFAFSCASNFVASCTPRDAGTARGRTASYWLLDEIARQGANAKRDCFDALTPCGRRQMVNIYCRFETDPSAEWVVLVSHYDTKPGVACPGANDGASTSALLVALARVIVERGLPKGNLMLIWTDGEECMRSYSGSDGFWGSRRAAEILKRKGVKVRAAICLDMLGDRDLKVTVPANGDKTLARLACQAARKAGLGDGFVELVRDEVKDDHMAFAAAGWKAIDLIDFIYGSKPFLNDYWHTSEDTIDKISAESLHKSGRLVAEMLNMLL
jgi:hypothetical protein